MKYLILSLFLVGCIDYSKPFGLIRIDDFCGADRETEKGNLQDALLKLNSKAYSGCLGADFHSSEMIEGSLDCDLWTYDSATCHGGVVKRKYRCTATFRCLGVK